MDQICFNGEIIPSGYLEFSPGTLLDASYVYQRMHVSAHRVAVLPEHLEILNHAVEVMYQTRFIAPVVRLEKEITALLQANRYPVGQDIEILLRVFPQKIKPRKSDIQESDYLIECIAPLLYKGYRTWHTRVKLDIFPCDYLFMGYPTNISKQIAKYGQQVAKMFNAEAVVTENFDKILTNVDDEPLFLVRDKQVITSPIEAGATDSVMRRKTIEACSAEGIALIEEPLSLSMLELCEEAFFPTVQGLTAAASFRERLLYNFTVERLIKHFK